MSNCELGGIKMSFLDALLVLAILVSTWKYGPVTYDLYMWNRNVRAPISRGLAFLCVSAGLRQEGLSRFPETALLERIGSQFGPDVPFELELDGTHAFFGLSYSEAGRLKRWLEATAAELLLELYDPQMETPTDDDRLACGRLEKSCEDEVVGEDVQRWLEEAQLGDVIAMNELGNCFASGEGVAACQRDATRWYEKAAAKGFVPALINLAERYRNGDGVAKDSAAAVRLYEQTYEQEKCVAAFALGEMFRDGEGVERSLDRAEGYFIVARQHHHPEAYLALKEIGRAPKD